LYILPLSPLFPDRRLYKKGAVVGTVEYERWKPQAKTLNMLASYYYYTQGKKQGWYDTLLVNRQGEVTEGTRTNFYTLQGNTIFTPPAEQVLEGVTYLTMLSVAKQNGYKVVHQPLPLASLNQYDMAFLTSTSTKIVPLRQINELVYPTIPESLKRLMKLYDEFLEDCGGVAPLSAPNTDHVD
jgi:branched-chain amino acid aminotransferase